MENKTARFPGSFLLLLPLLASCAHVRVGDVVDAAELAAYECGRGVASDVGIVARAIHEGGQDWINIIGMIGAGIGDAVCVARAVEEHFRTAHQVAGPAMANGATDDEARRRNLIRALARSVLREANGRP